MYICKTVSNFRYLDDQFIYEIWILFVMLGFHVVNYVSDLCFGVSLVYACSKLLNTECFLIVSFLWPLVFPPCAAQSCVSMMEVVRLPQIFVFQVHCTFETQEHLKLMRCSPPCLSCLWVHFITVYRLAYIWCSSLEDGLGRIWMLLYKFFICA